MPKSPASDTRSRILDAAGRLFHQHGYAATGVATILQEAGVNSGSLYHFFPSKEALLEGVLDGYLERLYPEIMQPVEAAEPDPIERVFKLLDWYRGFLAGHDCRLGCPIGNLVIEVSGERPELRLQLQRNFRNWTNVLQRWLEEAGDRLPADSDRESLARMVLTVMQGGVLQARVAGTPEPFEQSVAQLRQYFDMLTDRAQASASRQTRSA